MNDKNSLGRQGIAWWYTCMAILCLTFSITETAQTQGLPIGQWRHHLPGNNIVALAETPSNIIGASAYALLVYNKADNSVSKIDKVQGLSDFGITALAYDTEKKLIIIGYENGNLDIIREGQIINLPDIRIASVIGSKKINNILIVGNMAYLSCDFGIVEVNLNSLLINDTFYIGPNGGLLNVYELAFTGTHFYAATNQGIIVANAASDNLADFVNWRRARVTGLQNEVFSAVVYHHGKVIANLSNQQGDFLYVSDGTGWQFFDPWNDGYTYRKLRVRNSRGKLLVCNNIFLDIFDENLGFMRRVQHFIQDDVRAQDALIDESGTLWIGDQNLGLVKESSSNQFEWATISGPPTANAFSLGLGGERLWVAPGNISRGGSNTWNQDGVFTFNDEKWTHFSRWTTDGLNQVWDIIRIIPDPSNPDRAIAASWSSGILEIDTRGVINQYNHTNSTLRRRFEIEDFTRIGGAAFDRNGNLWVTNSQVERPLSVKRTNGQWLSFSGSGYVGNSQVVGNILIDKNDQKWVVLHQGGGIFLFKENTLDSNNDFRARRLTTQHGLPSNEIYCLAEDQNGYIWVGTDQGVAVFYAPNRAFSGEAFNAQLIIVEQDGFGGYLFENETINVIAVDGSNKKWFGTTRSGAFLLSADARETIFQFNVNNSPLPSNNILDIRISEQTGEVFFATDKGLVSFRGLATAGQQVHTDVYAYPNPVRSGYNGYIAIKGLVTNALVKITDISGNLVYETISEGGQAVWNGQDLFGKRPATGVYLVFSTNEDGSETMVTKILFIN